MVIFSSVDFSAKKKHYNNELTEHSWDKAYAVGQHGPFDYIQIREDHKKQHRQPNRMANFKQCYYHELTYLGLL